MSILGPKPLLPGALDAALEAKINDADSDTRAALNGAILDKVEEVAADPAGVLQETFPTLTVLDSGLDAEQARADAAYRVKDSTIYIPYDHSWWSSVGTETEAFGPDSSGNPRRVWGLSLSGATPADALSNPGAHTTFRVPVGWNTVSVKILYVPTTNTGGNAAWNGGIYNFSDGNNYNAGSGLASAATSVGTTAWVQKSHQATTSLAVDATKTQLLHIYRNALSSTDTYNDAVLFRGVEINWVS